MRVIPFVLLSVFTASSAIAAETELGDTVVTANRHETPIDRISATVTSVNRNDIDRRLPGDEADLFRDDPDVVMARDMRRHGTSRVNIRGIEDNRVVQMVDGVRLPDYYNASGPTNYTMSAPSAPMPDFLRQVEIVRGPTSSLYGSDAIGGVVGYLTLNPEDIARDGKSQGLRLRGSYFGASETLSGSVVGALRSERFDVLLGYAQAKGNEVENRGSDSSYGPNRSKANPADSDDRGALAKFIFRPLAGHKFSATFEGREQETQTTIMRVPASLSKVTSMTGDDETRRTRLGLEYEHKDGLFYDRLVARVYHQEAETHNTNRQTRTNARYTAATGCSASSSVAPLATCDIDQNFYFEQQTTGGGLQAESIFQLGSASNLLTYGIDLMRQRVETKRDGRVLNVNTGAVTYGLAGETYPLRDFANGVTDTVGLYVQDEISLFNDRLMLTPGLRYDHTKLQPEVDALAQQVLTAINRQAVSKEFGHVSPKLGGQWAIDDQLSLFGQIASGFRAPNYNEVNGAFRNSSQLYATSPNPDLKAETSLGLEIGLRARVGKARGQVTVFDNRYKDFIDSVKLSCPSDPNCVSVGSTPYATYMSRNLSNVRIYGAELRGSWEFVRNWRVDGALAYAHGENTDTRAPINTVEPLRASFGVAYDVGSWGSEWRLRLAQGKERVDDSGGAYFRTPGYGVSDLAAWIKPTANSRVTVAVNNLFDQKYWLWADVRMADSSLTAVDFYTQPGRNLRLAFQADF
jgi:hemoglobin/transferrin/lactoferrin receptor protein